MLHRGLQYLRAARRPPLRRYSAPADPQPTSKFRPIVAGALAGAVVTVAVLSITGKPQCPLSRRRACEMQAPRGAAGTGAAAGPTLGQHLCSADVVVFSTPWCPYCKEAVVALKEHGLEPKVVTVEGSLTDELIAHTNRTSVPQVFVRGVFVGGCHDGGLGGVVPLLKDGRLQAMLR
eukprot:GGOE01054469.1.p2 GENE.GGOE01054469.1~~GGOE01054469.1.p2  ORF type:complete len:196 (-),score=38.38 GGOE01054469.1:515-1045(-)